MKIERILCPTDLSPEADQTLRYALALAKAYDAKLFLLNCTLTRSPMRDVESDDLVAATTRSFQEAISRNLGLFSLSEVTWEGLAIENVQDVGEIIVEQAEEHKIDLIVMRSRRRPHRAALMGSTAESVSRTAPCPVLVTHTDEREWVGEANPQIALKRVLVAYDFSDYSMLALNYGLSIAQEYQAELHLLHVMSPMTLEEPEISWHPMGKEGMYHKSARRLQQAVPAEAHLWCDIRHAVSEGHPYREILSYADKNQIDLICIGAHGAGFGMRALFGSNVDRVLRQAPCPVLVAQPLKYAESFASESRRRKSPEETEKRLASRSPHQIADGIAQASPVVSDNGAFSSRSRL
jgi:nucleotide-binding universal stress UspA family protein